MIQRVKKKYGSHCLPFFVLVKPSLFIASIGMRKFVAFTLRYDMV